MNNTPLLPESLRPLSSLGSGVLHSICSWILPKACLVRISFVLGTIVSVRPFAFHFTALLSRCSHLSRSFSAVKSTMASEGGCPLFPGVTIGGLKDQSSVASGFTCCANKLREHSKRNVKQAHLTISITILQICHLRYENDRSFLSAH